MRRLLLLFCQVRSEFALKPYEIFEVGAGFGYYYYLFLEGEVRFLFPTSRQVDSSEFYITFITDVYYSVGFGFQYDFGFGFFEYFKFGLLYNLIHQKISRYKQEAYFATCFLMLSLVSNKFFEFGLQYTFFDSSLNKSYFGLLENYKKEDSWMFYFRVYFTIKKHFKAHLHLGKVSFNFTRHGAAGHEFGHLNSAIYVGSQIYDCFSNIIGGGTASYKSSDPFTNVFMLFGGAASQVRDGDSTELIQLNCQRDFLNIVKIIMSNLYDINWFYKLNPQNKHVTLWMCKGFFEKYANKKYPEMDMALQVFFDDQVLSKKLINLQVFEVGRQILLDYPAKQLKKYTKRQIKAVDNLLYEKYFKDIDNMTYNLNVNNLSKEDLTERNLIDINFKYLEYYKIKNSLDDKFKKIQKDDSIKVRKEIDKLEKQKLSKEQLMNLKKKLEEQLKIDEKRIFLLKIIENRLKKEL